MTINTANGLVQWSPAFSQQGANAVTVRVTDNGGMFDTQSFSVLVTDDNIAPTITSSPVLFASLGDLYSYDVDATDPDAVDTLTYSLDAAPAGMTINTANGLVQWSPAFSQQGANAVTVRVTDNGGMFDTQSFSVLVTDDNIAPTITSSPVLFASLGDLYSYVVDATDPDAGDTLTYSLDAAPAGMTINTANGLIEWSPAFSQQGANAVTVRVTDNGGMFDTQSFNVLVADNAAPVADAGPDQSVKVGDTATLDGTGSSDADGDDLTYSWSLKVPFGSKASLSNPLRPTPTFKVDHAGDYIAQLIVNDGTFDSSPDIVVIKASKTEPPTGEDYSTLDFIRAIIPAITGGN